MCFAGFLLFLDPPKAEAAADAARPRARAASRVKVVTGDNRHVAAHVARSVGLDADGDAHRRGDRGAARRGALAPAPNAPTLFVEIDPQQKERIVRALQRTGHAVGYLGDGINDAPALHAADVGISVDQAVDVARESADIVLLQPDLDVLRQGVEDGRRTFANTLKYIGITTSANFGNMVSMALAHAVCCRSCRWRPSRSCSTTSCPTCRRSRSRPTASTPTASRARAALGRCARCAAS